MKIIIWQYLKKTNTLVLGGRNKENCKQLQKKNNQHFFVIFVHVLFCFDPCDLCASITKRHYRNIGEQ